MSTIDVSAIIVNYNSGAYTSQLVDCLEDQAVSRPDGSPGRVEVVVVENCSPDDQSAWLDPLEDRGVRVLRSPSNLGYGGGCNLGTRHARGRNLLYLNPDVFILPGGVDELSRYLDAHPGAGQVGPRGWFDSHRFFHLPRIELPSLSLYLFEAWRRTSMGRARAFALRRTRHALRIWSAERPQEEPVLAGYAFMMPAGLARRLGPFDEDYPLYFEDADLTRRVRQAGYACMLVPASEMIHLYNKSAGQFEEEARRKNAVSQRLYWRKHYGRIGAFLGRRIEAWGERVGALSRAHEFSGAADLGAVEEPPALEVAAGGSRYVLELTLDPYYTLAVGRFDSAPVFTIPRGVWEHLDPTRFYLRALELPGLRPAGAWTFHKTSPLVPVTGYRDFRARLERGAEPQELER
jgi:GT2 family glycosyltransferase